MEYNKSKIKRCLSLLLTFLFIHTLQVASAKPALPPLIEAGENISHYPNMPKELIDAILARDSIDSIAYSPDGQLLASAFGSSIDVWDLQNYRLIYHFKHRGAFFVAFSSDGKSLFSSSLYGSIKRWRLLNRRFLSSLEEDERVLEGITSVAFSPNGKQFVYSPFNDKTIKLMDLKSNQLIHSFAGHKTYIHILAFSPDGKRLVSGDLNKTVKVWDLQNLRLIHSFKNDKLGGKMSSISFHPDGKKFASAHGNDSVKLWDLQKGRIIHSFESFPLHSEASIAYSSTGKLLANSSYNTIQLWDTQSNKLVSTFEGHDASVDSVAFNPDGKQLASASYDGTINLWNLKSKRLIHSLQGQTEGVNFVSYSPAGDKLIAVGSEGTINLWDLKSKRLINRIETHARWVESISLSPDGKLIAISDAVRFDQNIIQIWDLQKEQKLYSFKGQEYAVNSVAFNPNGKQIASASADETVKLWDLKSQKLIHIFKQHKGAVNSVSFSPNGKQLVSASSDETVKLWDLSNMRLIHSFNGYKEGLESAVFSPSGKQLALASSYDGKVEVWDLETQQLNHRFDDAAIDASLVFSPDGKQLAFASEYNTVELWDLKSKKLINSFEGHDLGISSIAFSPDGSMLVSSSWDKRIKLWDLKTKNLHVDLVSGVNGNWLWQDRQTGQFWRGDDGNFLLQPKKSYQSLPPPQMAKKDTLVITKVPQKLILKSGVVSKFELELTNNGEKPIWWIKTNQVLNSPFVVYPAQHYRLDKDKTITLTISVSESLISKLKSVDKTLVFDVITAAGSRFPISIPVTVQFPELTMSKVSHSK